jgi:hypothetical protein
MKNADKTKSLRFKTPLLFFMPKGSNNFRQETLNVKLHRKQFT